MQIKFLSTLSPGEYFSHHPNNKMEFSYLHAWTETELLINKRERRQKSPAACSNVYTPSNVSLEDAQSITGHTALFFLLWDEKVCNVEWFPFLSYSQKSA